MRNFLLPLLCGAFILVGADIASAQGPVSPVPDSLQINRIDTLVHSHYETVKEYLAEQDSSQHHHPNVHPELAWSGFGFGATQSASFDVRSTIDGQVCWQKEGWVYSANILWIGNLDPTGGIPENILNMGLLFGTPISERAPLLNVSAGLGFVHRRTSDRASDGSSVLSKTQWSVSIPVQVQLLDPFSNIFGAALVAYANLNVLNPTFGLLINFCSGKFVDADAPTTMLW
ncbi:MAG TPA: hypothetical protein VG537_11515 [Candidatus Kapabacteria bacterium]|jgi:hypothetical protein|nr:hypothetical protein [Candidatus Kapabacteria bacterium]